METGTYHDCHSLILTLTPNYWRGCLVHVEHGDDGRFNAMRCFPRLGSSIKILKESVIREHKVAYGEV